MMFLWIAAVLIFIFYFCVSSGTRKKIIKKIKSGKLPGKNKSRTNNPYDSSYFTKK